MGPETESKTEEEYYYYIYGSAAIEKVRSAKMIVSFYTYDAKFEGIWSNPTKFTSRMLNLKIPAVTTVDFTTYNNGYLAENIWQLFRSRWLGRYWQEVGLQVIPSVMTFDVNQKEKFDLSLTGIPKYANCISAQIQAKLDGDNQQGQLNMYRVSIQKVLHKIEPKQLLLYHRPNIPDEWYDSFRNAVDDLILVPTWMTERRKILKQKEYLTQD